MEFERRLYCVAEGPILLWHAAMILATSQILQVSERTNSSISFCLLRCMHMVKTTFES
jgi:hypothetical protein